MCILMYFGPGALPVRQDLECGCENNPDGFGYAIVTYTDGILTGHGMDADSMIEEFLALRAEFSENAAIFHARIATHGSTSLANTHPFEVGHRFLRAQGETDVLGEMYLAHNGILPCSPLKGDDRSDTKLFAEDILMRRFPHLDSAKTKRRLEEYMKSSGSKVAILTTDPAYRQQSYLFNQSAGTWVDHIETGDVWYSNGSWKTSYRSYRSNTVWSWPTTVGYAEDSKSWDEYDAYQERYSGYRLACTECKYPVRYCGCAGTVKTSFLPVALVRDPFAKEESVIDEDDPKLWECAGCLDIGTIDEDAKCRNCGVMYCCDQPTEACQCWDKETGKVNVGAAVRALSGSWSSGTDNLRKQVEVWADETKRDEALADAITDLS